MGVEKKTHPLQYMGSSGNYLAASASLPLFPRVFPMDPYSLVWTLIWTAIYTISIAYTKKGPLEQTPPDSNRAHKEPITRANNKPLRSMEALNLSSKLQGCLGTQSIRPKKGPFSCSRPAVPCLGPEYGPRSIYETCKAMHPHVEV